MKKCPLLDLIQDHWHYAPMLYHRVIWMIFSLALASAAHNWIFSWVTNPGANTKTKENPASMKLYIYNFCNICRKFCMSMFSNLKFLISEFYLTCLIGVEPAEWKSVDWDRTRVNDIARQWSTTELSGR